MHFLHMGRVPAAALPHPRWRVACAAQPTQGQAPLDGGAEPAAGAGQPGSSSRAAGQGRGRGRQQQAGRGRGRGRQQQGRRPPLGEEAGAAAAAGAAPRVQRQQQQQRAVPAEGELVLDEAEAAALGLAPSGFSAGGRVDIIEDFTNFTPDPPGHRAGFVAIIGRPNAGKSTLLNALLGQELSIVTQKAQTTRHRVLGILSEPGFQAVFLDTPGIIEDKRNKLEERMMANVHQAVREADCILALIDASQEPERDLAMVQPGEGWEGPPMAVVLNKVDLLEPEQREGLERWFAENSRGAALLPISALRRQNTGALVQWVEAQLPEGPSLYPKDIVSEAPERFFVSEIIRKHIFLQYRQEVPYSVAVEVVSYKERPTAKDYVEAQIVLEHDRQRGIIIGRQGSALKQLATAARLEIEQFLGRPVYLDLSVKVQEGWRKDQKSLERLGAA